MIKMDNKRTKLAQKLGENLKSSQNGSKNGGKKLKKESEKGLKCPKATIKGKKFGIKL